MLKKAEILELITNDYMNQLEVETGVKFTIQERKEAIQNHKDTLSDEEINLLEEDFIELISGWLKDSRSAFLEGKEF